MTFATLIYSANVSCFLCFIFQDLYAGRCFLLIDHQHTHRLGLDRPTYLKYQTSHLRKERQRRHLKKKKKSRTSLALSVSKTYCSKLDMRTAYHNHMLLLNLSSADKAPLKKKKKNIRGRKGCSLSMILSHLNTEQTNMDWCKHGPIQL